MEVEGQQTNLNATSFRYLVDEVQHFGENVTAAARVDRRLVERPRLLQHGTLLHVGEWVAP